MDLELAAALSDNELIARCQGAIRDLQLTQVRSLELLAESNDLLKLIEQIDSPVIAPREGPPRPRLAYSRSLL